MPRTAFVIPLLVVCTIVHTNCSTSQWMVVRCPEDGVSIKTPKNPSASYRLYGSRYEASYRSSLKEIRAVIGRTTASDSLKDSLKEFRTYLGKERTAIEAQLRKSVTRVQKNPCDSTIRKSFHFLLDNVNINARRLDKIAAACRGASPDLGVLVHEYTRDEE
jgi:hypothetical protein